jgi:hypothetical protein
MLPLLICNIALIETIPGEVRRRLLAIRANYVSTIVFEPMCTREPDARRGSRDINNWGHAEAISRGKKGWGFPFPDTKFNSPKKRPCKPGEPPSSRARALAGGCSP